MKVRASTNFAQQIESSPHRFIAAWGVHLGGYVGGVLGTTAAIISIQRARKQMLV